ncbi:MAG: Wzz/FepE/Etk N-terminal domain-containing protein [Vicinamibacterales bacterium]
MEETPRIHALDYLHVFRRRKWWLTIPILSAIVIGVVLVRVLPKEYRATATLAVEAPLVSPNLVGQTPQLDNQERLRALSQQLLSTAMLARVIQEEGLGNASDERLVSRVREAIDVTVPDPVANVNEPRRLDAFVVSYGDPDPDRAQRVANRLVTVFVDENSKRRTATAEGTAAFIEEQLKTSQGRLGELEARLRVAKESYMGQLPEQTQANLSTLSGLRQQLESNATALRGEQDRLSMVERQLEGLRQGSADASLVTGGGGGPAESPESRAVSLQRELAAARATYTDRHPEVQRLEEELRAARRDAEAASRRPESDRLSTLTVDPGYRQLVADRELSRLRIRDLQRSESDLRRQIGVYQARVESAPRVEQQLAALQRDYDLERQQYSELSSKLHAATIAENVERNRSGEQFTVLYPARRPSFPTKPVPWRVMLIAIAAGICVGAGATVGREYLDRSVHDARDLREEFQLPVLGEVTRIQPV